MGLERYSPEKHKNTKQERLSPEQSQRLDEFRDLKQRWEDIKNVQGPGPVLKAVQAWKVFRGAPAHRMIDYKLGGQSKHHLLEEEQSKTQEGQMELAQTEASFFNEAFDIRAERLNKAAENKDTSPEEYNAALASFDELVQDLKEGDLKKYDWALNDRAMDEKYGTNTPSDLTLEDPKKVEEMRGKLLQREQYYRNMTEEELDKEARQRVRYGDYPDRSSSGDIIV